ncbi:MAG: DUF4168 domain-containing protein [Bacteroidetes bacterium]|nr:MAG: DUF4168 domain-containing protein [Bacteroidota bacterium]
MLLNNRKIGAVLTSMLFAFALVIAQPVNVFAYDDNPENEEEEISFRFEEQVLLNFFDANQEISQLQRQTQERMAETVEQLDLTLERFNQIARANQIGALQGGAFSDDEIQAFNQLGPQVSQIQREQQMMISTILEEKGFSTTSYQEILNEYRSDQDLQAHVRELLRERRRQEILEERRREAEEKAQQEQN